MRQDRRFARYTGVSLVATALAQVGLATAYGVIAWPVVPAVLFSAAVSAGPAYLLSKRYVWPDRRRPGARATEATGFFGAVLVGSFTTIAVVWFAVLLARTGTANHVVLTAVANSASVMTTGLVWVARYFVLDRLLFSRRGLDSPVGSSVPILHG